MNNSDSELNTEENQISILALIQLAWVKRSTIIIITAFFVFVGLILAVTSPKEWSVSASYIPENNESSGISNSLGGIAGLAGVQFPDGGGSGINPEIYPNIVASSPFLIDLMNESYYFKHCSCELSIENYLSEDLKKPLLKNVFNWLSKLISRSRVHSDTQDRLYESQILSPSPIQYKNMAELRSRIGATLDKKTGILSVSVKMQDAEVTAQMVAFTVDYLSGYVTEYLVGNEQRRLKFIENQIEAKEKDFERAQSNVAEFKDKNQSLLNNVALTELENLESIYSLEFSLLSNLNQKRADSEIKVEERTPVLTVLEPIKIPYRRSEPKMVRLLIISALFGITFGGLYAIKEQLLPKKNDK